MDKIDFINWLLEHFDVSDFIYEREIEKYSNGLIQNIDYLQLRNYVEEFVKSRPSSVELNRIANVQKFFIKEKKDPAIIHFEHLKQSASKEPLDKLLSEESKQKIRDLLARYGKKPIFDK